MTPRTPTGLKAAGKRLWTDITGNYDLRADELILLEDACRERDIISRMETALAKADVTVKGSMGQQVMNPMISEIRQHRMACASLIRQMKLPDEGSGASGGTPLSVQGRDGGLKRWSHASGA